ncbi:stalk domain-containing protein [Thermoanaerobacter mathranii]|uniref:stalk domain-containing protein n=1 Tax=Thermoanaerobacter mathranii TaxID=583357 RepID=UPI003AABB0BC
MKKFLFIFFIFLLVLSTTGWAKSETYTAYKNPFPIIVNGQEYISDLPILNFQGRTYVPLKIVGDMLGASVKFDEQTNKILIEKSAKTTSKEEFITVAEQILQNVKQRSSSNGFNNTNATEVINRLTEAKEEAVSDLFTLDSIKFDTNDKDYAKLFTAKNTLSSFLMQERLIDGLLIEIFQLLNDKKINEVDKVQEELQKLLEGSEIMLKYAIIAVDRLEK